MNDGDLVTLDDVKAYLGGDLQSGDDGLLQRLISATSIFFATSCGRPVIARDFDELYDGAGGTSLYLRHRPVISVNSVAVNGRAVPTAPDTGQPGWRLAGDRIILSGHCFFRGTGNVRIAYRAGYESVPPDIAEAVLELVGLRYRGRDRLGKTSESLGGMGSSAYSQKDVGPFVQSVITKYTRANLA